MDCCGGTGAVKGALFRVEVPAPPYPLFDCHVHIGPSDSGELYYPDLTGEEYLRLMDETRVAAACVFPPFMEQGYRQANAALADWAERHGNGRILPFARLGGRRLPITEPQLWMVRRRAAFLRQRRGSDLQALDELERYRGVKLLPHLDGLISDDEFARINELGLPVLIHGGRYSTPGWIEREVAARLRTPLIIAHLGAFPCEEALLESAVAVASRRDNVYLDTSGAWTTSFLRFAAERVPNKLVFGSDAPLTHPLVAWHHLASCVHDDRLLEDICARRGPELFGFNPPDHPPA